MGVDLALSLLLDQLTDTVTIESFPSAASGGAWTPVYTDLPARVIEERTETPVGTVTVKSSYTVIIQKPIIATPFILREKWRIDWSGFYLTIALARPLPSMSGIYEIKANLWQSSLVRDT